jgi:RAT1-interacting protein
MIMFSIYEKHSDWLIAVIKFKNAFFLCEYVTDQQMKANENMTAEHRSFCAYGHKFEEYVTKSKSIESNRSCRLLVFSFEDMNINETIDPSKQFTGVFQSSLDAYRLLYGAEMDCILQHTSTTSEHIELKLCAGKSLQDLPLQ